MAKNSMKPRIRFKGFTDAWEQREFNSIAKRITEMTDTEDLPRVEYEDIVSGQGTLNKDINKKKSCKTGILFDNGDVLFGKLRPYLKNWLFATFMGIAVGDFWVLRANNADGLYIYTLLQIDAFQDIANQSTGTKMPRADWSLVSKQRFLTPTVVPEQRKIGEFFKQLDNLITLHQRKQKCKFLSFPTSKAGLFLANSWEQRKLGDVGKAQSGIGFPDREQGGKEGVPFYKVSDMNNYGNEHEMHSANNYVTEEQCRRNGWTPITEISVVFAKVGAAIMLNRKRLVRFSFLLDNNTMAYRFGSGWDINFGKTLFERVDLTELVQIGALPSYNATDVESVEISMPDKPEQYQIGEFFKQLDNLITLHQCKDFALDTNKAFQQRCLLSIKSANAWEQRKLGEMGETYAGLSSKSKEDFGHGEAEFVPYMNVFTNPIADVAMTEAIEIDDRQAKVKNGDVLFTTSSETPEEVGMSSVWLKNGSNTYLNSFCFGFRASESINSYYLAYMLRSSGVRRKIVFLAQGISRYNISKKKMMEIKVPMPISAEQRQLGEIFRQLDNLITLHQRKQTIKKRSKMDEKRRVNYLMIANAWEQRKLREVFDYERPDTYIVKSDKYSDTYSTPVLTANKGFILGYTNEMQVCNKECIIFDDFTLDSKYVTFPFMVKSSALKILTAKIGYFLPFAYQLLQATNIEILGHARHYISVVQPTKVLIPSNDEQIRIGKCIQQIDNLITLHQRGLIKIQGDKKWQKRKFQKNCSAIILNAG